jgi:D-sedoheptulose 7-phosphate isomerase
MNTSMNIHIRNLVTRCPGIESARADVEAAFAMLRDCYRTGGKLLLCGNGGSASDAEHWAGELLKGFARPRPLSEAGRAKLPAELANKLQGALPAIPLTGFPALTTAFGNDVDPQLAWAQLVWGLGKPGDVLVGISTSGNATNVCAAMEAARARDLRRIGLTGAGGGRLASLTDICLRAPAVETYRVQEYHLPIYHCLCLMLEDEFFGDSASASAS